MPEPESLLLKITKSLPWSCPVFTPEAKGRFIVRELVEVEMLKMLPEVPVETLEIILLMLMLEEAKFLLESVTTKEEAVSVAMFTLPEADIVNKDAPLDEAMVRSGEVPAAPCRVKVEEVDVVPTENFKLVLSQLNKLVALKAPAAPANWMLPGVPLAKVAEEVPVIVICPGVVVLMVMLVPATKLVGAYFVPVPSAASNWPVTVGSVDVPVPPRATESCPAQAKFKVLLEIVPWMLVSLEIKPTKVEPKVEELVPPLAIGNIPVTSLPLKLMAPLNRAPVAVERTGNAAEREVMVEEPTTTNVCPGVVVPMPTLPAEVILNKEIFEEEETLKGSKMPLP